MIAAREELLRPLAGIDGLAIIDSDPSGYPGSSISEFVALLGEHRGLLDRLRPDIELVYWMHIGWGSSSRLYELGELDGGTRDEHVETLMRLKSLDPEPWSVAILRPPALGEAAGWLPHWVEALPLAEDIGIGTASSISTTTRSSSSHHFR